MITSELLIYIRQEFASGKKKEEIRNDLVKLGGWAEREVDEAFGMIGNIASPVQTPVQYVSYPSAARPAEPTAELVTPKGAFPYGIVGVLFTLSFFAFSYLRFLRLMPADLQNKMVFILLAAGLVPVMVLRVLTSLFQIPTRSWGKAFFVTAVPSFSLGLITVAGVGLGIDGTTVGIVAALIGSIGWLALFARTYRTSWGRAFAVGFIALFTNAVIFVALLFMLGIGGAQSPFSPASTASFLAQ